MDIVEQVGKKLGLSREETVENSEAIEDGLTYYWNPVRGGASLIINEKGDYLAANSSVSLDRLLEEYKKGERVRNIFSE